MDSLKVAPTASAPRRVLVGPVASGPSPSSPPVVQDEYQSQAAPVQLFLTRRQALELVQAETPQAPPELPKASPKPVDLKEVLPEPIRAVIDGVRIPGTPGRLKPRFDNGVTHGPSGLDFKMRW